MIKFGHDGWYGEIAREITFDSIQSVVRVAGALMVRDTPDAPRLAVGYDRRFLSDAFARSVARELAASGIEIWLTQRPLPAPAFAYSIGQIGAAGGIYITGGALPANVSGLKLMAPDGGSLPRWMLAQIETSIARGRETGPHGPTAELIEYDPMEEYLASIDAAVPLEPIQRAGITLAIDPMWGTASGLLPRLTDGGGSRSVEIRTAHNPRFPEINAPIPIASNLERLRKIVMTGDADFGVGLSGDGCSVAIIDERGRFISPGTVFAMIAYCLLHTRGQRGPVARTISTSSSVDAVAEMAGVLRFETAIGLTAISETLREQVPLVMGDGEGGIIMPNHVLERDGILASMLVTAGVVGSGLSASEVVDEVVGITGERFLSRTRVPLTENQRDLIQLQLARQEWPAVIGELSLQEVYQADGVKLELENDAWLLVRYDDIDQVLEMVAESRDADTTERLQKAATQLVSV